MFEFGALFGPIWLDKIIFVLFLWVRGVWKLKPGACFTLSFNFFPGSWLRNLWESFGKKLNNFVSILFLTHVTCVLRPCFDSLLSQSEDRLRGSPVKTSVKKKNYRTNNTRLETKFMMKNDEIKDFQDCFSPNSFSYNILKICVKNFGKKLIQIQIFLKKNSSLLHFVFSLILEP